MQRKGFFLVFSLWLFLLLSLFCLGLAFRTFIEVKKTKLFLNKTRAFYLSLSGIKLAKEILKEDSEVADYPQEQWALLAQEEIRANFTSPKKEGSLKVNIEDECSRININTLEHPNDPNGLTRNKLKKLFEEHDVEDFEKMINYMRDYIDSDDLTCAPDLLFSEEDNKDDLFTVVEELLLVKDVSKEDYEKISQFLTIRGDKKININTARRELLEVLIEGDVLKSQVFSVRAGENGVEGDEDDGYYGSAGTPLPLALATQFKTSSNFFRIISQANVENITKKITCILERDSGKIIYWYEE
ncbi:MAG: general secretion pathway protein GspK [Candidatus Omnitrophota bacterium]|nr:MAG: general secretion pathway protein GspK [Candidatus Omnitrophota bacterium]